MNMATATLDTATHQKQRAALHTKLKNSEGLKAAKNRAAEELEMAREMVKTFQRMPGYIHAFELAFSRAAQEFGDLTSVIPGELQNSCQDESLRNEFESVMAIRSRLVAEHQDTRQAIKRAELDLHSTRTRIKEQRGEPAILKQGDPMPWGEGFIQKTFTKMQIALGQTEVATWALSEDMQNIAFAPSVRPADAKFHSDQWFSDLKALRMARAANTETEQRLAQAEEAKADIKQRMIWSPI